MILNSFEQGSSSSFHRLLSGYPLCECCTLSCDHLIREAAFKTIVRPQLEYVSTVWSPHTKQDIKKIEMVQRRAVRWSLNSYSTYASVTEMQNQLKLRTLEQRRADARVIMLFKIIHGLVAIPLPSYFKIQETLFKIGIQF